MASVARELGASYAFGERNVNLIKRYWGWEVVWIMYTIANSLAVVFIAQSVNSAVDETVLSKAKEQDLILFLAIGAIVWHYLAVVFALEIVAGALLIANRFVPAALTILAPLLVNIVLFHATMAPAGYAPAVIAVALWSILIVRERGAFLPLFAPKGTA